MNEQYYIEVLSVLSMSLNGVFSFVLCICTFASSNSVSTKVNKKVEEEEKLLKLFQGVNKSQQDGFMQWCEQTLHTLNTANNLDGESECTLEEK